MKYYIIISEVIYGVGGSMIYQLNKLNYYKRKGWQTKLYHKNLSNGQIVIEALKPYNNLLPELNIAPYLLPQKKIKDVIDNICSSCENCEEAIVECDSVINGMWGELVAKKLKGKNIVFILGENQHIYNWVQFDFCRYKLLQQELFCIKDSWTKELFNGWLNIDNYPHRNSLPAYCTNVLDDIKYSSLEKLPRTDYIIGSIGRIEKNIINKNIDSILKFVREHRSESFLLLLIGGCSDDSILTDLKERISEDSNLKLHVTGTIYPIPLNLVQIVDVFISCAGSCAISQRMGIPTISCDATDCHPIGIYKYTTDHTNKRDDLEPPLDAGDLLEDIIYHKKYCKINTSFDVKKYNEIDFTEHEKVIYNKVLPNDYYFNRWKCNIIDKFIQLIISAIGIKTYIRIRGILKSRIRH